MLAHMTPELTADFIGWTAVAFIAGFAVGVGFLKAHLRPRR